MKFDRKAYRDLNSRQQENYNFQKVSAVLADYGFATLRLSADWQERISSPNTPAVTS